MKAQDLWAQIEDFEAYNRSRNLSPKTVRTYGAALEAFCRFFQERYGPGSPVTAKSIREFVSDGFDRGLKPNTLRSHVKILRTFFSFLVLDGIIEEEDNPMRHVKNPRVPATQIRPLTDEEVKRLLASFDIGDPEGRRNYTVCLLILDTGLRLGEVTRLTLKDIDPEISRINVKGKGGKERSAYMGRKMTEVLRDYMEKCHRHLPVVRTANGDAALFVSLGKNHKGKALTVNHLSAIIRLQMDRVGISRAHSSAHRLRHTFGVNFIRNGGGAFPLQRLLGHTTLAMTRRYVLLAEGDLQEAARKASPVDRLDI